MKENLSPQGYLGTLMLVLSCLFVLLVDPLFLYIPVLNNARKCIGYDKALGIVAITLRTISDILCMIYIIIPLWNRLRSDSRKLLWIRLLHYIMAIIPLPQVLMLLIFAGKWKGDQIFPAATLILGQHVLRLLIMFVLILIGWAQYAVFLCFFCSPHVVGAFRYFSALSREVICWTKACKKNKECSKFNCDASLRDYSRLLNYSCSTTVQNLSVDNFGLYHDVVSYGIVHFPVGDSPQKILFCLRWSLQSLSSFGQSLQTSDDAFENIFVILISMLGIILFVFLLAVTQRHLRSKAERLENRKLKVVAINKWKPFKTLSLNIQLEVVEEYLQCQETENVNAENLFNDLSSHLKRSIKHQLCFEMLKKVEEFGKWSEDMLYHMCDYVKPVFYMEDIHIVWERDLIDQMLFVLQGRLRMYSFSCSASDTTRHRGIRYIPRVHENGDFCREELVAWFQADPYSSNLPISTRTIRTATRVEGFALMSEDLRVVLIEHHKALFIQSYWRTKMMLHFTRNATNNIVTPPDPTRPDRPRERYTVFNTF
ncbi:hypothetical protein ACOSQ3_028146 [Xanthoceras sorbifolium]